MVFKLTVTPAALTGCQVECQCALQMQSWLLSLNTAGYFADKFCFVRRPCAASAERAKSDSPSHSLSTDTRSSRPSVSQTEEYDEAAAARYCSNLAPRRQPTILAPAPLALPLQPRLQPSQQPSANARVQLNCMHTAGCFHHYSALAVIWNRHWFSLFSPITWSRG